MSSAFRSLSALKNMFGIRPDTPIQDARCPICERAMRPSVRMNKVNWHCGCPEKKGEKI